MKKIAPLLILICIYMLLQACSKDVKCVDFTATELSWIPYTEGQVVSFKSNLNNSVLKITASKVKDTSEPYHNPYESINFCTRFVRWSFSTTDNSLPNNLDIDLSKRTGGKGQSYWFQIEGKRQLESWKPFNVTSEIINGVNYDNVLTLSFYNNFDTVYYGKNVGYIAFHKKETKEWFYKQ